MSWYARVMEKLDQLISVGGSGANQNTQDQILDSLIAQTNQLSNLLIAQSELLQTQSDQLEKLNTTYSETLIEKVSLTGARTIPQPPVDGAIYQTFELVAVDVIYVADSTPGERYPVLERFIPSGYGFDEFPQAYLAPGRVIGTGWQNATIEPGQSRGMTWAKDSGNDGYTRVPIPQFPLNVASGVRWRLRLGDYVGPDDTCTAVYQLRVFKA